MYPQIYPRTLDAAPRSAQLALGRRACIDALEQLIRGDAAVPEALARASVIFGDASSSLASHDLNSTANCADGWLLAATGRTGAA